MFIAALFRKLIAFMMGLFLSFGALFASPATKIPAPAARPDGAVWSAFETADTPLAPTVALANRLKNGVQGAYTDAGKTAYRLTNENAALTHTLGRYKSGATLASPAGETYLADTLHMWCRDTRGGVYSTADSGKTGRVNTVRLGEYYYECHVRDLDMEPGLFRADKTFHVYSDRLYMEYAVLADQATDRLASFGCEAKIPYCDLNGFAVADKNGVHTDLGFDPGSVEYAAFDIKNAGVIALIAPPDGSVRKITLRHTLNAYVLTVTANYESGSGINKYDETGDYADWRPSFGCRIYTDETHDFAGAAAAAYEERHPLTGVTVNATNAGAVFEGYNARRGSYDFSMTGSDFNRAFYREPDARYEADVTVTGADDDRDIFIRMRPDTACLEAGVLFDENRQLLPVDVEVCKNFQGDGGDETYSYADRYYSDMIFPLAVKAGRSARFISQELYQNWGKAPLKQLSSIEFHVSYYHLSTGVTETNCIAPYFTGPGDGWLLPDFRCRSGRMWSGQPQFNSVGMLYFCEDRRGGETKHGEYAGSTVLSPGPVYADILLDYVAADGAYAYTLRHSELPQTDENRTFYTVSIRFLRDTAFKNLAAELDLFRFEGRFNAFDSLAYLDEANAHRVAAVDTSETDRSYPLGSDCPYFSMLHVTEETQPELDKSFGCNAACLVRGGSVTRGGATEAPRLAVRETSVGKNSTASLVLNEGAAAFRAGDEITLDLILLPWGTGLETDAEAVKAVREDSCLHPFSVTNVPVGETGEAGMVPAVKSENNRAVFTVEGGRSNCAVRVTGVTVLGEPNVKTLTGSEWTELPIEGPDGHDGYSVRAEADGTFTYAFIVPADGGVKTLSVEIG